MIYSLTRTFVLVVALIRILTAVVIMSVVVAVIIVVFVVQEFNVNVDRNLALFRVMLLLVLMTMAIDLK